MRRRTLPAALVAVVVAIGCGAVHGSFDEAWSDLGTQISEVERARIDHATHVEFSSSLPAIRDEEMRYFADAQRHEAHMSGDVSDMMDACSGTIDAEDTIVDMRDTVASLVRESVDHLDTMDACATMPTARTEESRHQDAMRKLLDRMEWLRQGLANVSGSVGCGHMPRAATTGGEDR